MDVLHLKQIFHHCFWVSEQTILEGGALEPSYRPGNPSRIIFRSNYERSALHEIAHWCLAGGYRRRLEDYGYWYSSDDRDYAEQSAFFTVEARPQAIECIFCDAANIAFSPSVDNLSLAIGADSMDGFSARIRSWKSHYEKVGLPSRAAQFLAGLRPSLGSQ